MKFLKTGIFVILLSMLIYTQASDVIERALFGGSESRNMSLDESNVPSNWDTESGANILWRAALGSQTYTNPTIVGNNLFIATNNEGLKNPELKGDRGVLMAFGKTDGTFLWQATHEKLKSGLVNDWPLQGICSTPYVEGDKIYYVSNRCEVVCIDAKGFLDGENNGPYTSEVNSSNVDADIIWKFDMMDELDVFPHNLAAGSPLIIGDILYTVTGNGVDESHILLPSPAAPSFIALNKNTGELIWEDSSPGENILHGTWSNPAYGIVNGEPQVVFPGGDGWLYSFEPKTGALIWKFNCNPEGSKWILGGSGTKNNIISTPVFYDNKVYLGVGQDPEHGEAPGHFWVIDASGKGDITKTGVVWHRGGEDFYRTMSTAAIANDLLFISDLSGYLYCLDPKTGAHHWTYDTEAAIWGSPMVTDNKVYLGDEDGDVVVFKASNKMEIIHEMNMGSAVYSTPVAKDGVLYIASRTQLYAIKNLTE
jgi:outer membrane protein assembly factor BamB